MERGAARLLTAGRIVSLVSAIAFLCPVPPLGFCDFRIRWFQPRDVLLKRDLSMIRLYSRRPAFLHRVTEELTPLDQALSDAISFFSDHYVPTP